MLYIFPYNGADSKGVWQKTSLWVGSATTLNIWNVFAMAPAGDGDDANDDPNTKLEPLEKLKSSFRSHTRVLSR
eukprot:scaffold2642_cov120-Cylindrotheca_fusiformis.AAC.4